MLAFRVLVKLNRLVAGLWGVPADTIHSLARRPSQSLHQENHVAAQQMDAQVQDLQARYRRHEQGDGRARRAMAIRCRSHSRLD